MVKKQGYLPSIWILIAVLCKKDRGGLPVLAQKKPKTLQFSIYRGGIDCTEHQSAKQIINSSDYTP
jgi:hypothetical protein